MIFEVTHDLVWSEGRPWAKPKEPGPWIPLTEKPESQGWGQWVRSNLSRDLVSWAVMLALTVASSVGCVQSYQARKQSEENIGQIYVTQEALSATMETVNDTATDVEEVKRATIGMRNPLNKPPADPAAKSRYNGTKPKED